MFVLHSLHLLKTSRGIFQKGFRNWNSELNSIFRIRFISFISFCINLFIFTHILIFEFHALMTYFLYLIHLFLNFRYWRHEMTSTMSFMMTQLELLFTILLSLVYDNLWRTKGNGNASGDPTIFVCHLGGGISVHLLPPINHILITADDKENEAVNSVMWLTW